jgi:hypothetical protein
LLRRGGRHCHAQDGQGKHHISHFITFFQVLGLIAAHTAPSSGANLDLQSTSR